MTQLKKNGHLPLNARINIKYNSNKPKISFSYPDKKNQIRGSMLYPIRIGGFFIAVITWFLVYFSHISLNNLPFVGLWMLVWYYVIPSIIYFPFKKRWDKLYPKYQAFTSSKKLAIFYPKDVKESEGKIYVELPVFSNIVCDFKCKGEFSDYLNEIDIREHKFTSVRLKRIGKKKLNKKQKRKRKVNEFLWYARWYFNKRPTKGNLEVIFK